MINILKNMINQLIEKNEELERQNAELKKFLEDDCNTSKPIELENINQLQEQIQRQAKGQSGSIYSMNQNSLIETVKKQSRRYPF